MEIVWSTIALFGGGLLGLIIIGLLLLKFYTLSAKEKSFVRTGVGGEKVVMNGGAMVIPGIHKSIWVNMKTLKLSVERGRKDSLITGDKMRVDVKAEFFVRVKADEAAVSTAAQTLGDMTLDAQKLSHQVEAKFIDALRSVAATMTMHELHEKRAEFVQHVQAGLALDLQKNGLELESVSLTSLNQTDKEHFDANNAFDAEGLAQLTRQTEARRKDINSVQQETRVAVAEKDLETNKRILDLKNAQTSAQLDSDKAIALMTAAQQAETVAANENSRRQVETAALEAQRAISEARIANEEAVETAGIAKATHIAVAEQEQAITVANKSRDEAAARAEAADATAKAVAAEERVTTAQQVEIANRSKQIALVKAEETAQRDSIGITVLANAERDAASARAEGLRVQATGERDAAILRADGTKAEGEALALALQAENEARNKLSPEQIAQQVKIKLLEVLPSIIEMSVRPLERINSIRIAEVGGLHGSNGSGGGDSVKGGLGNEVVSAALRYRGAQPIIDGLLAEVGLKGGGNLDELLGSATSLINDPPADSPAPVDHVEVDPPAIVETQDAPFSGVSPDDARRMRRMAGLDS